MCLNKWFLRKLCFQECLILNRDQKEEFIFHGGWWLLYVTIINFFFIYGIKYSQNFPVGEKYPNTLITKLYYSILAMHVGG